MSTPRIGPRPCPLCGAREGRPWLLKPQADLRLARCPACNLIYLDPIPAGMDARYYNGIGQPYYLSADKLAGDLDPVRFERELALFRRHCAHGSVLDVGCSTGGFLAQLAARWPGQYHATGIEVSQPAIDHARQLGLEVVGGSFPEQDFGGRRFDAITFWAVLEHLPDPARFVAHAAMLLAPGGRCFVLVPNARSLAVRLLGARYRYILPQHLNYFSATPLRDLLQRAGLKVVAEGGSHFNPVVLWQDARRGHRGVATDAERAALLRRTNRWKTLPRFAALRWMLRGVENQLARLGLADNLWAVARPA